ncbi:MAG: hypothetical protein HY051_02210 [Candidatus Aenigmarchaeota archaeon]|nr:hypothetical protein [Candidatus Aenigmarchaeota archaeon]
MFIEKVVIPFLEANKLRFIRGEGELLVLVRGSQRLDLRVLEIDKPPALLLIADDLVTFPKDDPYLLKLLNELNETTHTKWIAEDGELHSVMTVLTYEGFNERAFQEYFDCAVVTAMVMKIHLLEVRYGGKTLRGAMARRSKHAADKTNRDVDRLITEALGEE